VITVFLTIGFGSYVFANFSGKEAVFSGIAMLTIGEFSLLIAKEAAIVNLGIDLISIVAAIIFISAIVMPFIIGYQEKIYHVTKKLLPIRLVDEMRLSLKFINNISFSMFSRRMDMRNIYSDRRKIFYNFMALLVMSIAGFWIWRFFGQDIMIFERGYILYLFIMLIVIAILFPVVNILRNGWKLFKDTLQFFTQLFPQEQCDERSIFRNILLLALFFLLFLAYTFSFAFFNIHPLLHVLSLLLLAFVLYYLLRCSRLIRKVGGKHLSSLDKSSKKYQKIITDKIYGNEEKK
jgi:hypothetical protein